MTTATPQAVGVARGSAVAPVALGVAAQVGQVLIFRELLATCRGGEPLFGVILSAGLAWTALGSFLGTWLTRSSGDTGKYSCPCPSPYQIRLSRRFAILAALSGLLLAGQIVLARAISAWGASAAGEILPLWRTGLIALVVTAPASIVNGMLFVLALRLHTDTSRIYRLECWGAVVGGLLFTFILVQRCNPIAAALLVGALFAAAFALRASVARGPTLCLAAALIALACLPLDRWSLRLYWSGALPGYELTDSRDTPYGRVSVLARPGTRQRAIFHDSSLVATLEPGTPPADARQMADLLACLHPAPRRMLLIGGSIAGLPEELLRHDPLRVDALELDPALVDAAQLAKGNPPADPRIHRTVADGRRFVRDATSGQFDLAIVSAGDVDSALSNRFCTVEFFGMVHRSLADGGVLVVGLSAYGSGGEYTSDGMARRNASISQALREVFPQVRAAPIGGCLLVAAKAPEVLTLHPSELATRLASRPHAHPVVRIENDGRTELIPADPQPYFEGLFGGVLALQKDLDGNTRQHAIESFEAAFARFVMPPNRDARPIALAQSMLLAGQIADADLSRRDPAARWNFAELAYRLGGWAIILPVGLALVGVGASRQLRTRWPRTPALYCSAAAGLFGMAVELALLAGYQNARGYVYGEIGLLLAAFMAGLAIGSHLAQSPHRPAVAQTMTLIAMILLAGVIPRVLPALSAAPAWLMIAGFWLLMIAAGILVGAMFPLLTRQAPGGGIYAADLAGAAVGALLVGAAWLPLLGMTAAMLAVALLAATALVCSSAPVQTSTVSLSLRS